MSLGIPCRLRWRVGFRHRIADDPEETSLNLNPLAALKLDQTVVFALADHEIDFDQAFVVDDIEAGLVKDCFPGGM